MIYEIVCNETYERYIGSTFEPTLARRISKHRHSSSKCKSKQIIQRGNYSYGLLEKVDTTNRDELRMVERKWYDVLDCINQLKPYTAKEERKEYMKEFMKEYQQEHKEQLKEYKKAYYLNQKALKSSISSPQPLGQL